MLQDAKDQRFGYPYMEGFWAPQRKEGYYEDLEVVEGTVGRTTIFLRSCFGLFIMLTGSV